MHVLGAQSAAALIGILQNRADTMERRLDAASAPKGLRCRDAVAPLLEALAEGDEKLSWMSMSALTGIGSRRGARRLMAIVRGKYPLPARQEAICTLLHLQEFRAESLFIRVGCAIDNEEEFTRDMATEALGITSSRPGSQRALARRLFDPSASVRYAALCALSSGGRLLLISCLRRALEAKLHDPDKIHDDHPIATFAAKVLGRACG